MSSDSEGFVPENETESEEEIEIQMENQNTNVDQRQTQQSQTSGGSSTGTINFECPSMLLKPFAIGPFNPKRPLQQFFSNDPHAKSTSSSAGGGKKVVCNFCSTSFTGSYTRLDAHLTHKTGLGVRKCPNVNKFQHEEIIKLSHMAIKTNQKNPPFRHPSQPSPTTHASSSSTHLASSSLPSPTLPPSRKRGSIHDALNVQAKEAADDAVSLFFYAHGLPFLLARSPYLKDAFEKVRAAGPSYVLPGENRLRTSLLEKQYAKCSLMMHTMKTSWVQNGCSIVMDGWTDIRQHPLINIIVTCPDGPFFLRAIDCSGKKKDSEFQFHLLKQAIEDVGPSNVVQVITDAAPVCKRAGKLDVLPRERSTNISVMERGLRFLQITKRTLPAAVHSIVIQAPNGLARTHRFATESVDLPAQGGERATVSLAAPSNVGRFMGPLRLSTRTPGWRPGEPMSITNHVTGLEVQLLSAPPKSGSSASFDTSLIVPVLALVASGDAATAFIDPSLPKLISTVMVSAIALGTIINSLVLPKLNQLPQRKVDVVAIRQQLLSQYDLIQSRLKELIQAAEEEVWMLARMCHLENKIEVVGETSYSSRKNRVKQAQKSLDESLVAKMELIDSYTKIASLIEIEVEMDTDVLAAEAVTNAASIAEQIEHLMELEDLEKQWRIQAEANDEVERLLRSEPVLPDSL